MIEKSAAPERKASAVSNNSSKTWALPTSWSVAAVIAFGIALRGAVSMHPYSGENTPPSFGDYEAQRHWMEITLNLPATDWYRSTSDNDLTYWGLDYPPLSGYTSWVFGKFVGYIEPKAVRLRTSRGFESSLSRAAMRFTVILSDLLIFFPGLLFVLYFLYIESQTVSSSGLMLPGSEMRSPGSFVAVVAFCTTLPAFILIDHGHFQYNSISLGLFLLSLNFFMRGRESIGSALFCSSVYFKHLGLYYGLAIFSYLLSRMVNLLKSHGVLKASLYAFKILLSISVTTLVSFWPWALEQDLMADVLRRLFPISRGLYEDKVANVWCSISVLIKLNKLMEPEQLFRFCAAMTVFASLPFCIALARRHSHVRLLLATSGCALASYLFSYQVHEKQILIPLLPLCLLYGVYPFLSAWASYVATFSMFPLLLREGHMMTYVATMTIHLATITVTYNNKRIAVNMFTTSQIHLAAAVGLVLHVALIVGKPPDAAPDIFVVLNTSYSCAHLCLIYVVMVHRIWTENNLHPPKGDTNEHWQMLKDQPRDQDKQPVIGAATLGNSQKIYLGTM